MIIGHQKIRERLARSVEKDACVQAYLFVGPESVGKFEVAKEFALRLIGGNDVASLPDYQKEPDLFIVEPEQEIEKGIVKERDISVERAREASRWLGQFPYASAKKVLIIRDAHRLTEAAQNALLKIVEEPPSYAVIILVTHEIGKILPTTRSRCQQIFFRLIAMEEMSKITTFDPALKLLFAKDAFLLELGRPGIVMQSLQQESRLEEKLLILEKMNRLSSLSLRDRLALSESCIANVAQTIQLLMWWVGGLHAQTMENFSHENMMRTFNIEKIEKLRGDLKRFPSSARLILDSFFLQW